MALPVSTSAAPTTATAPRPVSARHFARLKLRVMANGFRGQTAKVVLFVLGLIGGLWFAAMGFFLLLATGATDNPNVAVIGAGLGGAVIVLGWVLLPLVFFGVDETLDPARFALLPLTRRTLVTGLLTAALIGAPALATLLATGGLVVAAGLLGGLGAALVAAVGVVGGVLLCVAASRAVTSAFAGMLRSRRVRDLAAVLLAVLAALLAPLQLLLMRGAEGADWDRVADVARIVSWTPIGAPYTAGLEVAQGRWWAALLKLAVTAVTIAVLLVWWSRTMESAMVGTASAGPAAKPASAGSSAVGALFPRLLARLPRNRFGALVAREARYWWRDARRRSGLITLAVIGVFVPVMINLGGTSGMNDALSGSDVDVSPLLFSLSMVFVGTMAALNLANQFGYDGSAYAANVIAGVPGQTELRARFVAYSLYMVPLLVLIALLLPFVLGEPAWAGVAAGTLLASYGAGLGVNALVSVIGAYDLPETSNPFAMNTGAGMTRSLLSIVALLASVVATVPLLLANVLLPGFWLWLALPAGLTYGVGGALLGAYIAGDRLDRRMPELLHAVTPRR
ncbi:ABC transporter permease [Micromonosporaceae bacterium DT55]|uniref:ABC transporter permease n=1 Tax=Melissospora conviva TaxID=3388432 RepID=UPI003C146BED